MFIGLIKDGFTVLIGGVSDSEQECLDRVKERFPNLEYKIIELNATGIKEVRPWLLTFIPNEQDAGKIELRLKMQIMNLLKGVVDAT